jgi:hypothetical protein
MAEKSEEKEKRKAEKRSEIIENQEVICLS